MSHLPQTAVQPFSSFIKVRRFGFELNEDEKVLVLIWRSNFHTVQKIPQLLSDNLQDDRF